MKRFILAICILTAVVGAFAQRDYYIGVPLHEANVKDSARIVLDMLPWNLNGRLDEGKMPRYLEPIKQFLTEHPGFKCNIHLYGVESNEEKNLAFTTYQAKRLGEYFTYEDTLFEKIISTGSFRMAHTTHCSRMFSWTAATEYTNVEPLFIFGSA